jgi:arylsulfatase B
MYPDVITQSRKTYLGMVTAMDDLVGSLINDLKASGMYEDSVIIFSSDNGGMLNLGATNYPLTGQKSTLFEGGVRVPGFVHSPNHIVNPG